MRAGSRTIVESSSVRVIKLPPTHSAISSPRGNARSFYENTRLGQKGRRWSANYNVVDSDQKLNMADGKTNSKLSGASVRRRAFDPINSHYFGRLCSPVDEGFSQCVHLMGGGRAKKSRAPDAHVNPYPAAVK
jgi:hypothetical protein